MITGILLAAGAGTRFGGRKLLHPLPDGLPVGLASLRNLSSAVSSVVVVVRPGDDDLRALLVSEGALVIECRDAERGMGHSLAAGVAQSSAADGWVIALGDMPRIQPASIGKVVHALEQGAGIVVPVFAGERGHPVAFDRRFRAELLDLTGDTGARTIVQAHSSEVRRLDVDDPAVVQDVDTVEDARRLAR
jgi:molybdenum cofactor cytidylyltransferase